MKSKKCPNSFPAAKTKQSTKNIITITRNKTKFISNLLSKLTPKLKPVLILLTLISLFSFTSASGGGGASEPVAVEDWESSNYNKTGQCESIASPKSEKECFSQTNATHSCCMVNLNGTYADPYIIDLYPAPVVHHRLRMLGGAAAAAADTSHSAADTSHSAADTSHSADAAEENKYQFQKCVAIYKSEKAVASVVRKFKYNGTLYNSYFVCNTTLKINPCGMAGPGKFEDCKSHSSKKKKCCMVNYMEMQTCGLDLGLPHNNSNHLGVKFTCSAFALRVEKMLLLFVFLVLGFGEFV